MLLTLENLMAYLASKHPTKQWRKYGDNWYLDENEDDLKYLQILEMDGVLHIIDYS